MQSVEAGTSQQVVSQQVVSQQVVSQQAVSQQAVSQQPVRPLEHNNAALSSLAAPVLSSGFIKARTITRPMLYPVVCEQSSHFSCVRVSVLDKVDTMPLVTISVTFLKASSVGDSESHRIALISEVSRTNAFLALPSSSQRAVLCEGLDECMAHIRARGVVHVGAPAASSDLTVGPPAPDPHKEMLARVLQTHGWGSPHATRYWTAEETMSKV